MILQHHNPVCVAHYTRNIYIQIIIWSESSQCSLGMFLDMWNSRVGTWANATWTCSFQPSFSGIWRFSNLRGLSIFSCEGIFNQHNVHVHIPRRLTKYAPTCYLTTVFCECMGKSYWWLLNRVIPLTTLTENIAFFWRRYWRNYSKLFFYLLGV